MFGRRDPRLASRVGPVLNLATVSAGEIREAMQARRRPLDPVAVVLGRCALALTAAGEVDPELALSYAIWPTEAMLEAVAKAD